MGYEQSFNCPECPWTLESSDEHVKLGKEPFEDIEWNEDKSKYRQVFKCVNCGYTDFGPWITPTRSNR